MESDLFVRKDGFIVVMVVVIGIDKLALVSVVIAGKIGVVVIDGPCVFGNGVSIYRKSEKTL